MIIVIVIIMIIMRMIIHDHVTINRYVCIVQFCEGVFGLCDTCPHQSPHIAHSIRCVPMRIASERAPCGEAEAPWILHRQPQNWNVLTPRPDMLCHRMCFAVTNTNIGHVVQTHHPRSSWTDVEPKFLSQNGYGTFAIGR